MRQWSNLCQIAISVLDIDASLSFYKNLLGYTSNRKTQILKGPIPQKIQGYKGVKGLVHWINDKSPFFQLELFQYHNPPARPMPSDVRPCDIGFCRLGIWVADFDTTVDRLKTNKVDFLTEPKGYDGGRRVGIKDPDGVVIEIMENDICNPSATHNRPLSSQPVRTRSLTLSVPDIEQAEKYFIGLLGMQKADITLHTPDMEELWGLAGAQVKSTLLWCDDFLLELVEYLDPRGQAKPPDNHIGDAGLWHMALKFDKRKALINSYQAAIKAGHSSNSTPLSLGFINVVYMKTDQDVIVEYIHNHQWVDRFLGF